MSPETIAPGETPRTWRVVFLKRSIQHWWDFFSPPWCRHVLAYGYVLPADRWIVVNPLQDRTMVSLMTSEQIDEWLDALVDEEPVIYRVEAGPGDTYANRIFQTCSSVISRVIGLPGSAWRPMALVRMLERTNATIIHEPGNERQG